jgi:hypothetical protein
MPSAKELRDELRKLRKESATHKPVSKMRVMDIAAEIERMKAKREETAPVASTPADKSAKKMVPKISDLKESKAKEFPVAPSDSKKKVGKKEVVVGGSGAVGETTMKSSSKKSKLEKLLAMMESDSE